MPCAADRIIQSEYTATSYLGGQYEKGIAAIRLFILSHRRRFSRDRFRGDADEFSTVRERIILGGMG